MNVIVTLYAKCGGSSAELLKRNKLDLTPGLILAPTGPESYGAEGP